MILIESSIQNNRHDRGCVELITLNNYNNILIKKYVCSVLCKNKRNCIVKKLTSQL